ncbi:hypothetical protein SAMN05428989_3749 [Pseudoxanthomonas sp. GM95]|uniref:hypothetical protein n=1 Tax=Pseudoxanthomonas sp. GM95 TaxID=1881043 RepID=UPI0008BCFE5F|nr:hypothetical protein [Pseudoxanthomonas sp. GM95]SEM40151.1 hypothetical protein SAMN05428989_3749 [Pseudoxanthomonas sp. GM95]
MSVNAGHAALLQEKDVPDQRRERRISDGPLATALRAGLNEAQLKTLRTMEQFQWKLGFIRRPMFGEPVPVIFDRDGKRFVTLERDGRINERPGFSVRR